MVPRTTSQHVLSISEARTILKNLKANNMVTLAETLQVRILQCEHAQTLGKESVKQLGGEELAIHLMSTKELWPKYSLALQVRICFVWVRETLKDADAYNEGNGEVFSEGKVEQYKCLAQDMLLLDNSDDDCQETFDSDKVSISDACYRLQAAAQRVQAGEECNEDEFDRAFAALNEGKETELSEAAQEVRNAAEARTVVFELMP